jgi:DNA-binding IclR family transcriptional regulator
MAMPLHAGSGGRAILAEVGLGVLADDTLQRFTEDTVVDRGRLADELSIVREDGFVISVGQHLRLAAGVAAPFVTALGEVGAVSVTQPRVDVTTAELRRFGPVVRRAADALAELSTCASEDAANEARSSRSRVADSSALGRFERLLELVVLRLGDVPTGRQLGRVLGVSGSTALRLLDTAQEVGLVRSTGADRVVVGPLMLRWAATLGRITELTDLLNEDLVGLAAATGETCALSVFESATGVLTLSQVAQGTHPVHYGLNAGETVPLWAGAAGKAVLAHCPEEVVQQQELSPLTPRSPKSLASLERDLLDVRRRGWAEADGERIPDAFGLAAPFFAGGRVVGSITVTMPRIRRDEIERRRAALIDAVVRTAGRITELLTT